MATFSLSLSMEHAHTHSVTVKTSAMYGAEKNNNIINVNAWDIHAAFTT
jgi:hypothetical protein